MSEWRVERLGRRGDGVAVGEGGTALAALTLPGEHIEGVSVEGRIDVPRILTPAAERVKPACRHYLHCGGCDLMHAHDEFVAQWKRQVVVTALAAHNIHAPVDLLHTSPPHTRRRAVFSARRTKKGAIVGFHARRSTEIVRIDACQVLLPDIVAALPLLGELTTLCASRSGELRLSVLRTPAGLDILVEGAKPLDPGALRDLAALLEGSSVARLSLGAEVMTYRRPTLGLGPAQIIPPPGGFFQATEDGEHALQSAVISHLSGARRIVDLFAGCGTFSLPLAKAARVHAVEGLAAPLEALSAGWRTAPGLNPITTEIRDLARNPLQREELNRFDAIVIDPPRAGAEAQAQQIALSDVETVAFIACDPVNFARDSRILLNGGFKLNQTGIVDQFRWSHHIEIAAKFTRG